MFFAVGILSDTRKCRRICQEFKYTINMRSHLVTILPLNISKYYNKSHDFSETARLVLFLLAKISNIGTFCALLRKAHVFMHSKCSRVCTRETDDSSVDGLGAIHADSNSVD